MIFIFALVKVNMKFDLISVLAVFMQLAAVSATGCEVVVTDTSGASTTRTYTLSTSSTPHSQK